MYDGMPYSWQRGPLGKFITLQRGFDLPEKLRKPGEFPVISSGGQSGWHCEARVKGPGLVTGRYGSVGSFFIVQHDFWPLNTTLWARDLHGNDLRYLYYLLSSLEFSKFSDKTGVPGVNRNDLHRIPVVVPPLAEQRHIAEILSAWDEGIKGTQALIDGNQQEFSALAASLLTGRRRLRESSSEWTQWLLGDVTREAGRRNNNRYQRDRVKAVNRVEGMIPMKDHVIAGDLSRYRIVPPRGFAYNPMRLNIGSIAMNEHGREVLVSPDYVVFEALPGPLDPDFLNHFRRTSRWQRFMEIAGSGSVRVRIYYEDLAQMPLHLPPIDEQRRIAAFLSLARREMDLRRAELAALEKQKRGLMQKLLPGEWRVPVHKEEAEKMAAEAGGTGGRLA